MSRTAMYLFTAMLILIVVVFIGIIGSQFSERKKIEENMRQERAKRQEEVIRQEKEKSQNEKKTFEESIENHYAELVKLIDHKQFDEALDKVDLFSRFGRTDYKDVVKYQKIIITKSIEEKVKNLPASNIEGNLQLYNELLTLNPNEQTYKNKVDHYQAKWNQYIKRISGSSTSSKQWFEGGNLHKATYGQWKNATYQNKMATAADWLTATKWKGHLNSYDDFDKLKVKAQMLVNAIDRVISVDETGSLDSMNITEIAALIIRMSNDLGP